MLFFLERGKAYGEQMKNKLLKIFALVFTTIMLTLVVNCNAFAEEEIYFDEEGNLIYITYDKKATSLVSYKAIGWILKRYDAPIGASGQQYVIVRKIEYAVEDPENPDYLYCYFWSDKEEILTAVEKVSPEWRRQLERYGDTVYIDNVMTVCNSKVPLGNVDEEGNCTGEVYYTLEGIQNARPWARPEFLISYFDIVLDFPILTRNPDIGLVKSGSRLVSYNSLVSSNMEVGSNELGNEQYNVSQAMPAGELLYLNGYCSSYGYGVGIWHQKYTIYVPVQVKTKYIRNWVDMAGNSRRDETVVSRWYTVPKEISYQEIKTLNVFELESAEVSSSLFANDVTVYEGDGKQTISWEQKSYGDVENRIVVPGMMCNTSDVVLSSKDFKKPAIPEADYSAIAKKNFSYILVRSDYLEIDGQVVLSDRYSLLAGQEMQAVDTSLQQLYYDKIETNELSLNGNYDDFVLTYTYKNVKNDDTRIFNNDNINSVNIHTPVVCWGEVYGDKSINQAVTPAYSDLVLGGKVSVALDYVGMHNEYMGYGTRDYSEYVGKSYIRFEFPIITELGEVEANQWIELASGINNFILPNTVELGTYKVDYMVLAKNGNESMQLGENYNKNMDEYGAYGSIAVNVIGRLYDFEVSGDAVFAVGSKDKDGNALSGFSKLLLPDDFVILVEKNVKLSVTSMGELTDSTKVEGIIKYYYLDGATDELMPVDLYKQNKYSDVQEKIGTSIALTCCGTNGNNTYLWQADYILPNNFSVFRAGESDDSREELKDGTVFIVFDFIMSSDNAKSLSFINESNFTRGYCNMWRRQGGPLSIEISGGLVDIKDGTTFMSLTGSGINYDYEVNGTH